MNPEEEKVSNAEILEFLQKINQKNENIVLLSDEEAKFLREMIEDRRAISRVWSRFKIFIISLAGFVSAWFLLYDTLIEGLKKWLQVQ